MNYDFSHLIGIPYEKKHCWDLAADFYLGWKDIGLRHIFDGPNPGRSETQGLIYSNVGEFVEVDNPEFGDLIVLRVFGIESHIAVYVGNGKMLHTSKRLGSVLDSVAKWRRTIVGFYRMKQA